MHGNPASTLSSFLGGISARFNAACARAASGSEPAEAIAAASAAPAAPAPEVPTAPNPAPDAVPIVPAALAAAPAAGPAPAAPAAPAAPPAAPAPPVNPVADPIGRLHSTAAGSHNACPVCGIVLKTRAALGKHLARCGNATASAGLHATHAFASCPAGCGGTFCLLPKNSANGWSNYMSHITNKAQPGHADIRVTHGTWKNAETAARRDAVALAPPGSLGAALAPLVPRVAASASADAPPPSNAAPAFAASARTPPPCANAADADGHVTIPVFAPTVDLSCMAEIDIDQVRRVSRHLKTQDMPRQTSHVHDLVQPLVFALEVHAADPESERGGMGLWLFDLAGAFIFFRPAGTPPRTVPDMRQRATLLVDSVSNGTFPARWREFTAAAMAVCDAEDAGAPQADEDFDDYDRIPTVPLPPLHCGGRELRKATYLASKGELGMAWRCFQPSPAEDPRRDESKCALIGLNPQGDGRPPLTEADVADEPGHAPLQVSQQLVACVAGVSQRHARAS